MIEEVYKGDRSLDLDNMFGILKCGELFYLFKIEIKKIGPDIKFQNDFYFFENFIFCGTSNA